MHRLLLLFICFACFRSGFSQKATDSARTSHRLAFSILAGTAINNTYNNVPYGHLYYYEHSTSSYETTSNRFLPGLNIGASIAYKVHKIVNPVIGLGYIIAKHEYNHAYSNELPGSTVSQSSTYSNIDYSLLDHYVVLNLGCAFYAGKKLSLEPDLMIADHFFSQGTLSGHDTYSHTYQVYTPSTSTQPGLYSFKTETHETLYNHTRTSIFNNSFSLSAMLRLNYDFNARYFPGSCYIGASGCFTNRLTWYYLGLRIYPFKKLRDQNL